jgi:hypothetical protein
MIRAVCSFCRQRSRDKLATAYWAWFNADGVRVAWKLRYCLDDARQQLSPVFQISSVLAETSEVFACASCGIGVEQDLDPVYLTLYLPKQERTDVEIPLCGACAARWRIPITEHGEKQPDRANGATNNGNADAWAALGIEPNP